MITSPLLVLVTEHEGAALRVRVAWLHRVEEDVGSSDVSLAHLTDLRGQEFQARARDVHQFATGLVQLTVELREHADILRAASGGVRP